MAAEYLGLAFGLNHRLRDSSLSHNRAGDHCCVHDSARAPKDGYGADLRGRGGVARLNNWVNHVSGGAGTHRSYCCLHSVCTVRSFDCHAIVNITVLTVLSAWG